MRRECPCYNCQRIHREFIAREMIRRNMTEHEVNDYYEALEEEVVA